MSQFGAIGSLAWVAVVWALLVVAPASASAAPRGGVKTPVVHDVPFKVHLNGLDQTIMVHTNNEANPVLLVLHGGPGYAMLPLMHKVHPQLEDEFTVVSWDQRGAGLSPETDPAHLTLAQLVDDAHDLTRWLMSTFGQNRIFIMGHSFGTVIGLRLLKQHPADYEAFIGVGQTVNVAANEQYSYDWVRQQAESRSDADALTVLNAIGRPDAGGRYPGEVPDDVSDQFDDGPSATSHYVGLYGGDVYGATGSGTVDEAIFSAGVYDKDAWNDAWKFSQGIFDDREVFAFDFMDPTQGFQDFTAPVYFFMGQHDYDTPVNLFEQYYATVVSGKAYVRFDNSAHFPFFEEPEKFREELVNVKRQLMPPSGDPPPSPLAR